MSIQTPFNTPQDDDEISIWDVIKFFKESWRWLLGGVLLGLFVAVVCLLVTPKQYEATALFQGGKILGVELESSAQLIERLKFPTFYEHDQLVACDIKSDSVATGLAKQIDPVVLKGTSILKVSYRANDSDSSVRCLNAVMDRVIEAQNRPARSLLDNAQKQLELTRVQLSEAERMQNLLEKRSMGSLDAADTKFSQTVLLLSTSMSKKDQIASLRKSILDQQANLEPPLTRPAELIEPIFAPESAVSPKKLPVLLGALFGGLALGGLAFFAKRWLRSPRNGIGLDA